ncbi:MAG: hypothetical protein GEU93_17110 [Propionibacteriales bacterium]|nr:hypothetical protein [Propionibacteriales bacterium]
MNEQVAPPLTEGIITALVTPLDRAGEVDTPALDALVDFQVERGVHGLFVLGTSGEGLLLSTTQRGKLVEHVLARVAGKLPVAVHCGAADTTTAASLVSVAASAGARTVAAIPPLFFNYTETGIYEHYRQLSDAAPELDHYLYDNPDRVGYSLGLDVTRRLIAEVPCIRGIKDTGDSLGRITTYFALTDKIQVFTGNNVIILGALVMGAAGAVSTMANVVPDLFTAIYAAYGKGELGEARDLQLTAARLQSTLVGLPYVAAAKYLLTLRGLPGGHTRSPLPELSSEQQSTLEQRVHRDPALARWLTPVS